MKEFKNNDLSLLGLTNETVNNDNNIWTISNTHLGESEGSQLSKVPQHIDWIDTLKGLGIIFVVAGHIFIGEAKNIIFLFHMPLFFFIGGFLFKVETNGKKYLIKKTIHLLVPYVTFLILLYLPQEGINLSAGKDTLIGALLRPIMGGGYLFGWCAVFWFVTCFFLVQQFMNFLIIRIKEKTLGLIMVGFLCLGYINSSFLPWLRLPWSIEVVFFAAPIFYVGYILKYKLRSNFSTQLLIIQTVLILAIIVSSYFYPSNTLNMKNVQYGIPLLTLLCSFVIILFLITISKVLVKIRLIKIPLDIFGSGSMIIMYIHEPLQQILAAELDLTNNFIRFLITIPISLGAYYIAKQSTFGRAFFLGSLSDFNKIVNIKAVKAVG